jgi:hypothetical protein
MAGWLHAVDGRGLLGTAFMERLLKKRQTVALRELAKVDLTALYRSGHSKLTREQMQPGLFWSDEPPALVRIPLVRRGLNPSRAWLADYATYRGEATRKRLRELRSFHDGVLQVNVAVDHAESTRSVRVLLKEVRMRMLRSVDSSRERASGARERRLVDPGGYVAVTRTSVGNRS